jgi:hypothetical protein
MTVGDGIIVATLALIGLILKGRLDTIIRQLDLLFEEVYSFDLPQWRKSAARQDAKETTEVMAGALLSKEGRSALERLAARGLSLTQAAEVLKRLRRKQGADG